MGTRKGQNNFKNFQREKIKIGENKITASLKKIQKDVVFKTLNALVVHLARETSLNRTTILRNERYEELARRFFYQQPGIAKFVKDKESTLEIEQEKNFALRLKLKNRETELSNSKKQNQQLVKIIEKLGQPSASALPSSEKKSLPGDEIEQSVALQPADTAFADTAQALWSLIKTMEKKELGIVLDYKKEQIVDTTEIGDKSIIATPNQCHWFFRWLDTRSKTKAISEEFSFED